MDTKKRHPSVERYSARLSQPKIPDLNVANALFDPMKDGASTIDKIGNAQAPTTSKPFLSPSTIAGLAEMKRVTDSHQQPKPAADPPAPAPPSAPAPAEQRVAETRAEQHLMTADDLEYERLLRMATQDIINNDDERKAVEERVEAIDISEGLLNNEFRQEVPITKGLSVEFRSISPLEIQELKAFAREHVAKYPRLADLEGEIYQFMYTVAAVVSINKRAEPPHMEGSNYSAVFNPKLFEQKYETFRRRPAPLIHALIVHSSWFDGRVRKCFQWGALKNG